MRSHCAGALWPLSSFSQWQRLTLPAEHEASRPAIPAPRGPCRHTGELPPTSFFAATAATLCSGRPIPCWPHQHSHRRPAVPTSRPPPHPGATCKWPHTGPTAGSFLAARWAARAWPWCQAAIQRAAAAAATICTEACHTFQSPATCHQHIWAPVGSALSHGATVSDQLVRCGSFEHHVHATSSASWIL